MFRRLNRPPRSVESRAMTPSHAVIAGVNKAGTTSLFASLSTHPAVAPASIKETRYFLPARYGEPLEPLSVYDEYFAGAAPGAVRLEATPSYLYGGAAVRARHRRPAPGPAGPRDPPRAGEPRDLVLPLPEGAAALSCRPRDRRLPRRGRPPHRGRLRRPRQRAVHGRPRRPLRRLPPPVDRAVRRDAGARRVLRGPRRRSAPAPSRGGDLARDRSRRDRSRGPEAQRTARPATRAGRCSGSRSPATTASRRSSAGTWD